MINHIDVSTVLRRTVCDLYSNLVTRSTGAAVRAEIELQLDAAPGRALTIIDFTHVGLLDFSCADEIVAKLLMRSGGARTAPEDYFLFRGVSESHLDAIEAVLERHGLALVAEARNGAPTLVGSVGVGERSVWEMVFRLGRVAVGDLASASGLTSVDAEAVLETLCRRRLLMRMDDEYATVGGYS